MQVKLTIIKGPHKGKEYVFHEHANFFVGRGAQAHFRLTEADRFFSRLHFMVEVNPPACRLLDLNSRNGTRVNKEKVTRADLKDGDVIRAGKTLIRVTIEDLQDDADPSPDVETRLPETPLQVEPSSEDLDEIVPIQVELERNDPFEELYRFLPTDFENLIQANKQPVKGYKIIQEIGRGGMGTVYVAIRSSDGSVVALKTIRPAVSGSSTATQRFLREARILKKLRHPHIVSFHDMGVSNGLLFFAMDYVPGKNAAELVEQSGRPLAIRRAVNLACQMLDALEYAHGKGFVHRDIKPSNLLVAEQRDGERAKLADFGLARAYQETPLSGLTMTGDIAGTVPFMAPEQIIDFRGAKPSVDQYASAVSLYYLLTGRHIFDFPKDVAQQLTMILQDKPVPIQRRRREIPDRLASVIHRAMAVEPDDRFEDIVVFRKALLPFSG